MQGRTLEESGYFSTTTTSSFPYPCETSHVHSRAHKGKTSLVIRISRTMLLCDAMTIIITSFIVKLHNDSISEPIPTHDIQPRQSSLLSTSTSDVIHIDRHQPVSEATMTSTEQDQSIIQNYRWKPLNGSENDVGNAIFYIIYIPPDDPTAAMSIVKEQLNQIQKSSQSNTTTTLYYNLIGPSNVHEIMHHHNISFDSLIHNNRHQKRGVDVVCHLGVLLGSTQCYRCLYS
jgi:hypothetical protein